VKSHSTITQGIRWVRVALVVSALTWTAATVASQSAGNPDPNSEVSDTRAQLNQSSGLLSVSGSDPSVSRRKPRGQKVFLKYLPKPLLKKGPGRLAWWQWIALPLCGLVSWIVGWILSRITQAIFKPIAARTAMYWDDEMITRLGKPLTLIWALLFCYLPIIWLNLNPRAEQFIYRLIKTGFLIAFFWALGRSIDILVRVVTQSAWAASYPASRSLIPLAGRIGKVAVFAIAVIALLSDFGYPVASLVAGLGIGGLAIALAGQKTVENLFGAFSIGADQPFREGDFVKVEDFVGTVEAIGLRSTKIRTLDRTLISIPNGRLADMRLESFAARDRLRLACVIGLVYETTAAQVREVLAGFEKVLRDHPKIWPDAVIVRFQSFGDSSLNIEVMAWFQTSDWGEFQLIRQDILLAFMEVVEKAGTAFAFPTQTVHLVSEKE
jgi:MscS family membrane protein